MNGNIECAFIGRVGKEPELRTSSTGKAWAAFTCAVGSDDDTQWIRVAVFGDRAEQLASSLAKGDRVYCEGRLKLDAWTSKSGEQRTGLSVAAWKAEKLGEIGRNKPAKPKAPPEGEHSAPPPQGSRQPAAGMRPNDEIPFAPQVL